MTERVPFEPVTREHVESMGAPPFQTNTGAPGSLCAVLVEVSTCTDPTWKERNDV